MKPNFALSLSYDGLRLMHRVTGGWHMVGEVALDDADLTDTLERLRSAASDLEPGGISTKILIPNDQIKYLALDTTRAEDDEVREALQGATPYDVSDLVYDYVKGGGRTYVAAAARETLKEAEDFAAEYGFNPVCFAAVPEPFTYVGEAFLGAVDGAEVERDDEPVVVIGEADIMIEAPAPEPVTQAIPDIEPETEPDSPLSDDTPEAPNEGETDSAPDVAEQPEDTSQDANPIQDAKTETVDAAADAPEAADAPDAAPVFASLRADRNEGRPTPRPAPPSAAKASPTREEPTFTRSPFEALVVPTGKGTDPMPPLSAPSRDAAHSVPAAPVTTPISTMAPDCDVAPPVTGESATALSSNAVLASASLSALSVEPDTPQDDDTPQTAGTSTAAAAAVSGAMSTVGGMFASRRMAPAEGKAEQTKENKSDTPATKSGITSGNSAKTTVFGARKPPKKKAQTVVGGKPRFLSLILTAVLLVFLLAIAAYAALSDESFARWLGFGASDTEIASTDTVAPSSAPEVASGGVAPLERDTPDLASADPDIAEPALSAPLAPPGGDVLTPEEATRIYAATGVWQRAPRIPLTPRTTSIADLAMATVVTPVVRVPSSPLISASSVAGDALFPTPIDPPPPSQTFDFNDEGLVVATEQGAVTPDGTMVIVGRPPLDPPTRPGTIAPEITPQDQLAAVVPDTAFPVTDAPDGVIVIAGRPVIEPPVRTGTAVPAPTPEAAALASGEAPLTANDGLLVLAGSPPVLPPVRPGTVAPTAVAPSAEPAPLPVAPAPAPAVDPIAPSTASPALPEGINLIAGPPPVLPPVRPGTEAPQAAVDTLTQDIAAALGTTTAQTPSPNTRRPLNRPEAVVQAAAASAATASAAAEAAEAAASAPALGDLTEAQAAAFRPQTRPVGLAPAPPPEPEPEIVAAEPAPAAPVGLRIAPEIAAAVQAAANRPNPIVNATALAVPRSSRPDLRPRNMARIVERAAAAQQRAATTQVAAVAPRSVTPSGPTGGSVAQAATLDNAINLRDVNLIGVYGGSGDRRALVRLSNGRYQRVTVGDRLDGGRVTAISASALSYTKRGRAITLRVPG